MNRQAAHARLSAKVKNSPGVADAMRIYNQFLKAETAQNMFTNAIAPVEVVDSTDSFSHR